MQETMFQISLEDNPQPLSVNGEVEALLGFSPEDFLSGKVILQDCIHRDDGDIAQRLFCADGEGRGGVVNLRVRGADGRIRCVKGRYEKAFDASSGQLVLTLGMRDARSIMEPGDGALAANLKALLEDTTDFIYVKNSNHVMLAASKAVAGLTTGVEDWTALAGKTDYDLHPEKEADRYYRLEKQLFSEGRCVNEIQQIVSRDGSKHWIDNRKYPVNGADGTVAGLFGIAPEITSKLEAAKKLEESEESLREAQRIGGLGSFVLDIASRAWKVSEELCELLGIGPDYDPAFAGLWPLVHPDDHAALEERFQGYFAGERKEFDSEYRIIRQTDGAVRWVLTKGRLEFDGEGKPATLRGTVQDITERKQSNEALRKSEESLRQAQSIARLCSYSLNLQTGEWRGSETLEAIFGVSADHPRTVAGWEEILHLEDRERMAGSLARELERRSTSYDAEYRIVRPLDGVVRWLKGMGRIEYAADGSPLLLHGTIQDITDSKTVEQALRESKNLLQLFIRHAPVALAMFDREMRYLAVSERWLSMFDLEGCNLIGTCHYEVFQGLPESWKDEHRLALGGNTLQTGEGALKREDGREQWLRRRLQPWFTGDGEIGGIILFAEDVTAQKQAEERMQLAASVFTHAREGIVITDAEGTILDVNETFTRITGYPRDEVLGQNPRILKSGLQGAEFYRKMWHSLLENGQWSGEVWNRNKGGDIYPEMLTISAVRDEGGQTLRYVALFADITELKDQQRKLERIAHYDTLTGLPNRVLLADRLRQAMVHAQRRRRSLAVAYLDLDGFKEINDNHGHIVGDQVLSTLALRMKFALRESDTLARMGGDEFVALMLDMPGPDDALPVLERLLEAAGKPVRVGAHSLRVTASIGVVYFPQVEEVDADQLLRQADQAMYQAKLTGKNRYHIFSPLQDFSVRSRYESLEHVREALANCRLVLHYQPKVNMRTGKVIGAEALLRLQHPERGLLSPAMFMPATEDHPLAIEIGEWVIENALAQMEAWKAEGISLPVSVNVSGFHLQRPDFAGRLRTLLAAHPLIEPSDLELEVLESSALVDVIQASEVLEACHRMGVTIALDDFGTGYSSLTYLKQLPAHTLKIDRTFVSGMLDDREDLSIIEGVLSLAKAFRRQVIAEGVESAEHGVMLLKLGCVLAQGYGISLPVPAPDLLAWMKSWRPDPRWAQVRALQNGNRSLLISGVEHREMHAGLKAFLEGRRCTPPAASIQGCRLSEWLDSKVRAGYGAHPAVRAIGHNHQQFHAIVQEILEMIEGGKKKECLARVTELRNVRDELLNQLEVISAMRNGKLRPVSRSTLSEKALQADPAKEGKRSYRMHAVKKSDGHQPGVRRPASIYPE